MKRQIVLASTSPRRHTLLKKVVEEFSVCAPTLEDEVLDPDLTLPRALEELARQKAMSVAQTMPRALVIGADTIVCKDGKRLGKPHNEAEADAMLRDLSGATHEVITAVAMVCIETNTVVTNHSVSEVTFCVLTDEDISAYIATGESMDKADGQIGDTNIYLGNWRDKAGGYGIQEPFGKFAVKSIKGDYYNIVGLPVDMVRDMLEKLKVI